jgi:hypothetical protein
MRLGLVEFKFKHSFYLFSNHVKESLYGNFRFHHTTMPI